MFWANPSGRLRRFGREMKNKTKKLMKWLRIHCRPFICIDKHKDDEEIALKNKIEAGVKFRFKF